MLIYINVDIDRHPADEKTSDAGTEAMTGMVCEASRETSRK